MHTSFKGAHYLTAYRVDTSWTATGVLPQTDGTFMHYVVAKLVPR